MKIIAFIVLFFSTQIIISQSDNMNIRVYRPYDEHQFSVNWEMSSPTGNSTYLSNTSYSGGRIEYRHFNNRHIAVGLALGWNSYEQEVDARVYENEDGSSAVYSDMVRQIYLLPITVNAYYYFMNTDKIKPYAGLGIGTQYSEQKSYFNIYVASEHNWGFLVKPEIGLQYFINDGFGLTINGNYNYATNNNDTFNIDGLSNFNLGLGFVWEY